ncbi:MAG TPA: hypothetical protein VGC13_28180 [Longimicrobium sp.]|uniref:hypothetical protein n=1 Tax=Longimicrobium sp. TaxID=2029185 RepID=UPI002ED84FBF
MNDEGWTEADDIVEETREARRRLWERCDNDPKKYMAYMKELHQQLLQAGWVEAPPRPRQDKSAA